MTLTPASAWTGPSEDPVDEQFGDAITPTSVSDAEAFDAVLVGEPYDGAVISRGGAAEAPAALRSELAALKTHLFDRGPLQSIADLGDITIPEGSTRTVQDTLQETTETIHALDVLPVFLGGDNSVTYPNVTPLLDGGSVAVLSFDAHLDCRTVQAQPTSGTPYRQLFADGLATLQVLGARHFETSTDYHDYLDEQGGGATTAHRVARHPNAAVEAILEDVAADTVYVSVDVDVLDAAAAPGVSAPTPGGVPTHALFEAVRTAAADDRVAGLEVVECAPPLDEGGRTVAAAARVVAHLLGGALP
ncbi:MAG: formimidoylglutamase [Halobacteriaceae archaeon]